MPTSQNPAETTSTLPPSTDHADHSGRSNGPEARHERPASDIVFSVSSPNGSERIVTVSEFPSGGGTGNPQHVRRASFESQSNQSSTRRDAIARNGVVLTVVLTGCLLILSYVKDNSTIGHPHAPPNIEIKLLQSGTHAQDERDRWERLSSHGSGGGSSDVNGPGDGNDIQ